MKMYKICLVILLGSLFVFTSCEEPEENIDWRAGDTLIIQGSDEVVIGASEEPYYVEGFTIDKSYNWTLNGDPIESADEGQYVYVDFPTAGTYTIMVTDGTYEGEMTVMVE
ncbi:hypothetical protein OKW21_004702 [Catalinimonas alkaloidigena]|uniref:hypothetical protein n=1 Tax=Catalinimonas alkaloidigena TaxID=1075417 RepID=UPI0024049289|nr:hypothetical protein [Catalinimonas alkaloidigena]MDF9799439.1 hypothetical protein [Catalinimonas alkaloidigena]